MLSETSVSSTAELIVELIEHSGNGALLDEKIGTPLYVGILTDTGSFRFNSVKPRTHEVLAKLLSAGVKHHLIHELLNDTNTASRLRLQGFAMSQKMEILNEDTVAIISLTKEELEKYDYRKGDTDSLANLALSIKGMKAAMVFSERDGIIKISFRSKGKDNPVNILAATHFDGGGHANASGGMSKLSMPETLDKIKGLVPEYFPVN
jgi:phosphoesterase RecJ-like protein